MLPVIKTDARPIWLLGAFSVLLSFISCENLEVTRRPVSASQNQEATAPVKPSWLLQLGDETKAYAGADHSNDDFCEGSAVDSEGNSYCAGRTLGSVGETSGNNWDAFVMKVSPDGDIVWTRQLGADTQAASSSVNDASSDDRCMDVAVDADLNVYCAGYTEGDLAEPNGGSRNPFILKLDSDGNIIWLKQIAAPGMSMCFSIEVDASKNVYCSGRAFGTVFENGGGSYDVFALKLDSSGNLLWTRQIGADTQAASAEILDTSSIEHEGDIKVDSLGNVYLGGYTSSALAEASGGNQDAFIIKLDSSGSVLWATQLGGDTETASPSIIDASANDKCESLALDSSENILCGGSTYGDLAETNGGNYNDIIVFKLDASGALLMIKQIGSAAQTTYPSIIKDDGWDDQCLSMALDSSDNIYCAGTTWELGDTGTPWGNSPYVLKMDSAGSPLWVTQLGTGKITSPDYDDATANGISVGEDGSVFIGGEVTGFMSELEGGNDYYDIFMAKIAPDGSIDI